MKNKYNVVVLGKSGVGKSSFINYLYGEKVAETGIGRPVTGIDFNEYEFQLNKMNVKLYDTWGLEADRADEWSNYLSNELDNRSYKEPADKWFHSVFYCISAGGHRIEDFEIKMIKKFIDKKYAISIIFTKADQTSEEELKELKSTLHKEIAKDLVIIPICSESKTFLGGHKTKKFGKQEVEKEIYKNFWSSIKLRLPERCLTLLLGVLHEWKKEQISFIESKKNFLFTDKLKNELENRTENLVQKLKNSTVIEDEVVKVLKMYNFFLKNLRNNSYDGTDKYRINGKFIDDKNNDWFKTLAANIGLGFAVSIGETTVGIITGSLVGSIAPIGVISIPYLWHTNSKNKKELKNKVEELVLNIEKEIMKLEPTIKAEIESFQIKI